MALVAQDVREIGPGGALQHGSPQGHKLFNGLFGLATRLCERTEPMAGERQVAVCELEFRAVLQGEPVGRLGLGQPVQSLQRAASVGERLDVSRDVLDDAVVTNSGNILAVNGDGIAAGDDLTVVNVGVIQALNGDGIDAGDNLDLTNLGNIVGDPGVVAGDDALIVNAGLIAGLVDEGVLVGDRLDLTNSGDITGATSGVVAGDQASIGNTGLIAGLGGDGVRVDGVDRGREPLNPRGGQPSAFSFLRSPRSRLGRGAPMLGSARSRRSMITLCS